MTQPLQVEERHRQRAETYLSQKLGDRGGFRHLLGEIEESDPDTYREIVTELALSFAEAEAAVQKWERGFLISCPWCGLATRGEPVSKQIAHLIECGDKREAAVTEAVERRVRLEDAKAICIYCARGCPDDPAAIGALRHLSVRNGNTSYPSCRAAAIRRGH